MSNAHPYEPIELQDLIDERLPEARRAVVAAHAAECPICQREISQLRQARQSIRSMPDEKAPAALRQRVMAGLDDIDRERRPAARVDRRPRRRTPLIAGAGLLAAAAVVLVLVTRADAPLRPAEIAEDYRAVGAQTLALEVMSSQPADVEAFFRQRGITYPTRVFDLGMMGYRVVGGAVRDQGPRSRALFVYRGANGTTLVCQMYVGQSVRLPAADEVRENNGIQFLVHREGPLTLVFWQEGDVICVLASDAAPEEVIALAFAKAVKV